ncbi:hypothetical protein AB0J83_42090 [Actinoplanes sp. NPDC049596]|uniref:hypothetical protein n=1 Tax=unclassified Actinoplanes TaxID=2626549 RepID=UPI003435FFEB
MSTAGLHLRPGTALVSQWPAAEPAEVAGSAAMTYRGSSARLGLTDVPDPADSVLTTGDLLTRAQPAVPDALAVYLGLLRRHSPQLGSAGAVVVALPPRFADDAATVRYVHDSSTRAGLAVTRVVSTPVAAVAYAYLTGALDQAPKAAPTFVCDIDDEGATVTLLHCSANQVRPGASTPITTAAGAPDRAGVIGAAMKRIMREHGVQNEPIRLLIAGDTDLPPQVLGAVGYHSSKPVHLVRLADPGAAAALGAAAVAAGAVTVEDRLRTGISLSAHRTEFDTVSDRWPPLAAPHTLAFGAGHGEAVEVELTTGQSEAVVRLTADDGITRDVTVPLSPVPPAGVYQVSVIVGADGPALSFSQAGTTTSFPIPAQQGSR